MIQGKRYSFRPACLA